MSRSRSGRPRFWSAALLATGLAAFVTPATSSCVNSAATSEQQAVPTPAAAVEKGASIRLSGTVEAVRSRTVAVPRLQGPLVPLVIVGLVEAGTRVEPGDPLVEFDPQQQQRDAFDRRAEMVNLEGEIQKKRAEQAAVEAKDRTELSAAEHDVQRSRLDVRKNELIPKIDAEKNTLALNQAVARFEQLQKTFALKRQAATAEIRILEIRRERAERALRYAEGNAKLMLTTAPFGGLVVIRRVYRNGNFVEVAEGDEVRPGTPVVDIVDTSVMRVRAKVNQADVQHVRAGQRARVGLDGFPDLVFDGEVTQVTPLATSSQMSRTVRSFAVIVSIEGSHPQLLPDLTASVELIQDDSSLRQPEKGV
jgi:multidrug resistance efflux pump